MDEFSKRGVPCIFLIFSAGALRIVARRSAKPVTL